jgi:hypothetical protein
MTSDTLIMVRSNELACRNDWSKDLWEPDGRHQPDSIKSDSHAAKPVNPVTPGEIAALLNVDAPNDSATPAAVQEDVVVSEGMVLPERSIPLPFAARSDRLPRHQRVEIGPSDEPAIADQQADRAALDAHAAIRRAREQFRQRSSVTREAAPLKPAGDEERHVSEVAAHQQEPVAPDFEPAPLVPKSELTVQLDHDDDRFATIPEAIPGYQLPRAKRTVYQPNIIGDPDLPPVDSPPLEPAQIVEMPLATPEVTAAEDRQTPVVDGAPQNQSFETGEPVRPQGRGFPWSRLKKQPPVRYERFDGDLQDDFDHLEHEASDAIDAENDYIDGSGEADQNDFDGFQLPVLNEPMPVERAPVVPSFATAEPRSREPYRASPWLPLPPVPAQEVSNREMTEPVRATLVESDDRFEREAQFVDPEPEPTWNELWDDEEREETNESFLAVAEPEVDSDEPVYAELNFEDAVVAPAATPWSPRPSETDRLLDMTIRIAPDVPRCCRTCRDFRPAERGERGYCTNRWAFDHRRLVKPDDIACETSLGCFWLPADHTWLGAADVSAHNDPTPLMDRWVPLTEEYEEEQERRRRRS